MYNYVGERVVLSLSSPLSNGYTITCDNFFTTYNLAVQLLARNITLVGTVRKNKTFLPLKITEMKKKPILYSEFLFTNDLTIVSYVPKKNKYVLLMSSLHHIVDVRDDDQKKPEIIHYYNHTKGGVDVLDQLVSNYTCKRMTNRWPVALFSNMIDVSAYNSFVIWTDINTNWNCNKKFKRRIYLVELAEQLIHPHILRRERLPYGSASKSLVQNIQATERVSSSPSTSSALKRKAKPHQPSVGPTQRKRCFYCPQGPNSNKYSTNCSSCQNFICNDHKIILCNNCQKNN